MIRTNQGGSVASFIVVAAILVLATAGLLYWVKQGDGPKAATPEVAVSDRESDKKSPEGGQKVEENNTANNGQTGTASTNNSPSSPSKGGQQTPPSQTNSGSVNELSQTGPTDSFLQVMMASVLTGLIVAYIQSLKVASPRHPSL